MLTCLAQCGSNVIIGNEDHISTLLVNFHVRKVTQCSVFELGRVNVPYYFSPKLFQSGAVQICQVCEFEDGSTLIILNIGYQSSKDNAMV